MKRAKHKERRRKRKKSWYFIWFVVLIFFGFSLFILLMTLPIWQTEKIQIEGCRILPFDEVKKYIKIPLGENIFLADFSKTKILLSSLPIVQKVEIKRRLPSTVVVRIFERKEMAVLIISGNSMLIDSKGGILNPPERSDLHLILPDISDLPVIEGLSSDLIDQDYKLKGRLGPDIASLLYELQNLIAPRRIKVNLEREDHIMLLLDDILKVKIGDAQNIKEKIEVLQALIDNSQDLINRVKYIDVRFPRFPTLKF